MIRLQLLAGSLALVACGATPDVVAAPPPPPAEDFFVATIDGNGWRGTTVKGTWLPNAPILTVSATNPENGSVRRMSLYVQNRMPPGSYNITGYTAGINITNGSDSTITITDTHDPICEFDDPTGCAIISYGTITIDGVWGNRITGSFSYSMGAHTGSGSFGAKYP